MRILKSANLMIAGMVTLFAFGMLVCSSSYADLNKGLVAAWTFDDGTAEDQTGNKHDGNMVGKPKPAMGKFGM